jgi:hypothetical protein
LRCEATAADQPELREERGSESPDRAPNHTLPASSRPHRDVVEHALAEAVARASAAGEWSVVAQLARELEARRKAHADSNVIPLDPAKRGKK